METHALSLGRMAGAALMVAGIAPSRISKRVRRCSLRLRRSGWAFALFR
jgi:hypothetical protein